MEIRFLDFLREISKHTGTRVEKAILLVAGSKAAYGQSHLTIKEVCDLFEQAHLARPNPTILCRGLIDDRRVSVRQRSVRALAKADELLNEIFPGFFDVMEEVTHIPPSLRIALTQTPFIEDLYLSDLERMLELYAVLHTLENSMRRLIERVLDNRLGDGWWDSSASSPQKKKHEDRLDKEQKRKWLPARSSLGPLYSLDWSDLISIMRKFQSDFVPYLGEIDFLHRYSDLGLLRHVIAHNGFVDDEKDYERAKLALHDWQRQVANTLPGH